MQGGGLGPYLQNGRLRILPRYEHWQHADQEHHDHRAHDFTECAAVAGPALEEVLTGKGRDLPQERGRAELISHLK